MKRDNAILNFVFVLLLIGASAAVGIYRSRLDAQVFSQPLFEQVARTEVITASNASTRTKPVRDPTEANFRPLQSPSEQRIDPVVLTEVLVRKFAGRLALTEDELGQFRALFGSAAKGLPQGTATARDTVLKALNSATRARVPDTLLADAPTILQALKDLEHPDARRIRARMKAAVERVEKMARAEVLLKKLPLTPENLTLAAGNFHAVLAQDAANSRATQGLDLLEQQTCVSARMLASQNYFDQAFALLNLAEPKVQGGGAIRSQRAALYVMQASTEAELLETFSTALQLKALERAESTLEQLALFLPEDRITSMHAQIRNTELYGGFERGQSFSDDLLRDTLAADGQPLLEDAAPTGFGPLMRVLPIGAFVMGSPERERGRARNEGPQRDLEIRSGFAMSTSEISVSQFASFIAATNYQTDAEKRGDSIIYSEESGRMVRKKDITWRADYVGRAAADNLPVVHVSFNDANAYCEWLSKASGMRYRLPSEAEFEYAARAGVKTRYWWGDGSPELGVENLTGKNDRSESDRTWSSGFDNYGDGFWGPAPIKLFQANPFGLFDIAGNVSEWTADCWHDSYARAPLDIGPWVNPGCAQRVVRGGSWGSAPDESRAAARAAFNPDHGSAKIGFRVVREF